MECLIRSLTSCRNQDKIKLSVFDCGSTDMTPDEFRKEVGRRWNGELILNVEKTPFTRSYSFNMAVKHASTEKVFLCDTDMLLPRDFVELFNANVGPKEVWFPICFSLNKDSEPVVGDENGYWRKSGHGMVGILKQVFNDIGRLDERYIHYGKEDDQFYQRTSNKGYRIIRFNTEGLFHIWHPSRHW